MHYPGTAEVRSLERRAIGQGGDPKVVLVDDREAPIPTPSCGLGHSVNHGRGETTTPTMSKVSRATRLGFRQCQVVQAG